MIPAGKPGMIEPGCFTKSKVLLTERLTQKPLFTISAKYAAQSLTLAVSLASHQGMKARGCLCRILIACKQQISNFFEKPVVAYKIEIQI